MNTDSLRPTKMQLGKRIFPEEEFLAYGAV